MLCKHDFWFRWLLRPGNEATPMRKQKKVTCHCARVVQMSVVSEHQKRLVKVLCDGLRHSWTSRLPGTEVSTEVTVGIVGFVRSVRVVGVLDGLMEALEISEAGPDGVPPGMVDPSEALSTPVFSWRRRFRLNLARAFWNQTCKPRQQMIWEFDALGVNIRLRFLPWDFLFNLFRLVHMFLSRWSPGCFATAFVSQTHLVFWSIISDTAE